MSQKKQVVVSPSALRLRPSSGLFLRPPVEGPLRSRGGWRDQAVEIARATRDPLYLVFGLWLAFTLAIGVRTFVSPVKHTVFPIFATSAERWWTDQSLYGKEGALDHFRYPPVFAVAMTPLAPLGLTAGGVVWSGLSVGVYLAGLWLFARNVLSLSHPRAWDRAQLALFLALAGLGAARGLWNGQSNALAVGLLLLAGSCLAQQRCWTSATLLSLAVWLKLTPLAPVLLLVAVFPRALLLRLAVTTVALGLVPFLTRPPQVVLVQYHDFLEHLLSSSSERWPGFRDAFTVWQAVRESLDGVSRPFPYKEPLESSFYRLVQLASALACLAGCLYLRWKPKASAREDLALAGASGSRRPLAGASGFLSSWYSAEPGPWLINVTLAAGCAWLMLFGPAVEHATYAFLAPWLAWAVVDRDLWPRGRWLILAGVVLVLGLGWGGLTRPVADVLPLALAALPLGTVCFTAWLAGYALTLSGSAAATGRAGWPDT